MTGLTVMAGEGGTPAGDNLTLRGFSARNDVFVDGVRDLGPQSRDPFNMEQVEVVKGPQSAFTGRGSAGGSINLVSKSASLQPRVGLDVSLGTANLKRGAADINTPLRFLGERTGFRLNVMGHDSGVPGRDVVKNSRYGIAPTITFGLASPRATPSTTRDSSRTTSLTTASRGCRSATTCSPTTATSGAGSARTFTATATATRRRWARTPPRSASSTTSPMACVRSQFATAARRVTRWPRLRASPIRIRPRSTARMLLDHGRRHLRQPSRPYGALPDRRGAQHDVVTGFALSREGNFRQLRSAPNAVTTLLNPNPDDVYTGAFTYGEFNGDLNADTQAIYAFDTVRLGRRWQANGGLRAERFAVKGLTTAGETLDRTQNMVSLRSGLVFKPAQSTSLYASYGSSLNPSLEGLSYVGRGDDPSLKPEKTYTVETGAKWDLLNSRLLLTTALFQVEKTNARTRAFWPRTRHKCSTDGSGVRGVEVGATGHLTRSWMLFGGYTGMTSRIVESNNPDEIGSRFPQSPPHSFNLWSSYTFPKRVTLGGGVRYMGRRYNNVSNTRFVDGYWTADLMASMPLADNIDLRLNLTNLTDEYYFARVGGGHVVPGPARQLIGTLNFHF
ncbi:MAG: TonB-dependent siderophore receptor [Bryobacterales bacterium]